MVNVHLDPTNENRAQEQQLAELAVFVDEMRARLPAQAAPAILIGGDFNIEAGSGLYRKMLGMLHARDLAGEQGMEAPTYAAENSLTMWKQSVRIDFLLAVEGDNCCRVSCQAARRICQPPGHELSDHWAQVFDLSM